MNSPGIDGDCDLTRFASHGGWRWPAPRVWLGLACGVVLVLTAGPSEAFAASWASGVGAALPANAGSNPSVLLESVSCASAGNCSGVGQYVDGSGHQQGLLLSETAGIWGAGVEAVLPANAGASPIATLRWVSCASAGNCSAVGFYVDNFGNTQGLLLTETAGMWQTGIEAPLPSGAGSDPMVDFGGVSCASVGNCSAAGHYADGSSNQQGLFLTETAGTWAAQPEASPPPDAGPNPVVYLESVSCGSVGNCSAVGEYTDNSGNQQGVVFTEAGGTWGIGSGLSLPVGHGSPPMVFLRSVSCGSAGNCSAVGHYVDSSGHTQGLLLPQTAGIAPTGVEATPPVGAGSNPHVNPGSVSCASAGNCSAVGRYEDSSGNEQGLLLTESAGTWQSGVEATLPANLGSNPSVSFQSVSCASAGDCGAVGQYTDSSGHQQGLLLSETGGTWQTGVEMTPPANSGSNPSVSLQSVSCASADNCSAVGRYLDSSGHEQGLLLSNEQLLSVSLSGSGAGTVTGLPSGISCPGSCSSSYASGTIVSLTATPASGSTFAGWSGGGCAGTGTCTVMMSSGQAVTATFNPRHQSLTVTKAGSGSGTVTSSPSGIDCGSRCSATFNHDTRVTLTATPAAGSSFAGWSGGGCAGTGRCTVTISSDRAVTASFSSRRPALSTLRVSPNAFVLFGRRVKGRCVKQTHKNRKDKACTRPIKMTVSYRLNVPVRVTITIKRGLSGRTVKGRCVKLTRENRKHRRCTRLVAVRGALTQTGRQGPNHFIFNGRIGGHKLGVGSYRLTATAKVNGQASAPHTIAFKIVT